MDKYIIITFLLQQHLAFIKDLFSVFLSFVLLPIGISVSSLGNRQIFLDSTKLKIVWKKITTFFKRRVSIIL